VYELKGEASQATEYIGYGINLASRLQKYCPELGFIASARLKLPDREVAKHGYLKVVATQLRSFPNEMVLVDREEYMSLSEETRKGLFKEA